MYESKYKAIILYGKQQLVPLRDRYDLSSRKSKVSLKKDKISMSSVVVA